MSKLSKKDKFLDLSDYGRRAGRAFANLLLNTRFTSIDVTLLFGVVGLLAIFCILNQYYILALVLLILKSIIDAADGELARIKNRPSYTGRYLDSVFDIFLNLGFLIAIGYVAKNSIWGIIAAFFSLQLQGTLYNYYYLILRHKLIGGDTTSKIFEHKVPIAFPYEKQSHVTILYKIYDLVYGYFDKLIHIMDAGAFRAKVLPAWFMTIVSLFGLGFALLIMGLLMALGQIQWIIPTFIYLNIVLLILIGIRKIFLK